jgi:WD40 repeat protein
MTTGEGGPFTPGGRTLAAGTGRFIDVDTGKPVGAGYDAAEPGGDGVAVSGTGLMAMSVDTTGRIALWDVHGPTPKRPALPRAAGTVGKLAFSPRGDLLASVAGDGVLQLWDVAAGQAVGSAFDLHALDVRDLAFSPDGGTLYAAEEGAVYETPVDPGRVAAAVCARAGHTLSRARWDAYLKDVPYRDVCP